MLSPNLEKILNRFKVIEAVDTEFFCPEGERPLLLTICGEKIRVDGRVGEKTQAWIQGGAKLKSPPVSNDGESLIVAFYSPSEMINYIGEGWPLPRRLIDLFAEFRTLTNGIPLKTKRNLLGACAYFGISAISSGEKDAMRQLAMRGPPFSEAEKVELMEYCQTDVRATAQLFLKIVEYKDFSLEHALIRGDFMKSLAYVEHEGIPIDMPMYERIAKGFPKIKRKLIADIDKQYRCYQGVSFKMGKFAEYLASQGVRN